MEYETIYGQVVSKANSYKTVPDAYKGVRIIKSKQCRDYEASFIRQCKKYKGKRIKEPFVITLHIFEKSGVYDLDNGIKTILDCLQYSEAITNDNLCIGINATKHIDRYNPRIVFAIEPLQRNLFG